MGGIFVEFGHHVGGILFVKPFVIGADLLLITATDLRSGVEVGLLLACSGARHDTALTVLLALSRECRIIGLILD